MTHYHIRWDSSKLDWEAFQTEADARVQAERLKHPHERYVIEQADGGCERCANLRQTGLQSGVGTD